MKLQLQCLKCLGAPRDVTGGDEAVIYFWDCLTGIKDGMAVLLHGLTGWSLEAQQEISSWDS